MTGLLLDTHAFLWWITDDNRLGRQARAAIGSTDTAVAVSIASVWEIAIKSSVGKLEAPADLRAAISEQLVANGFDLLPTALAHATRVRDLPFHHRDPFDRLLFSQALEERLTLVSADRAVAGQYGVTTIW